MTITSRNDFYKSTELNAPPLQGLAGSLLVVLDGCLVDGFLRTVAITGITKSGTTATATISAADALKIQNGNILTISGATGADASIYNITAAITYTQGATTFTYTMGSTPAANATGTLSATTALPVTSITESGTTALVTITNANTTLTDGMYIHIAGATQTAYNGDFQIHIAKAWTVSTAYTLGALVLNSSNVYVCRTAGTSAVSGGPSGTSTGITDGTVSWDYVGASTIASTTFTYQTTSGQTTPATGTITYYRAGLQWTRAFSRGTNAQVYQAQLGNAFPLQIVDNAATAGGGLEAQMYSAEAMSADQTVASNRWPTTVQAANGTCIRKSNAATSALRAWTLYGNERLFTFVPITTDANQYPAARFGDFISYKSGDLYNTLCVANSSFNASNIGSAAAYGYPVGSNGGGLWIARSYTQTGTCASGSFIIRVNAVSGGVIGNSAGVLTYPEPVSSGLVVDQILITDAAGNLRGRLPGHYYPLHTTPFTLYDESVNVTNLSGVTLVASNVSNQSVATGQELIDKFGPWN